MDEDVQLEEKKPFSDENANDLDDQDVPDEILQLSGGDGRVWLIKVRVILGSFSICQHARKVPRFLMEKWQAVTAPNVHLATMRVYSDKTTGGKNRISLFLPDAPQLGSSRTVPQQYDTSGMPKEYLLDIVNQEVENQVVISEREMNPSKGRASEHLSYTLVL
jgi:transcription initiation factor TFIIF subunit beta